MAINKKTVGGFFLLLLTALIFFSKTVYTYNLPVVTATKPQNGRLSKLEMSTGVAEFAEVENLYTAVGGTVAEVLVGEGDRVGKGQELLRLSFDRDEAERKLREIQNSRDKLQMDIQNITLKLEKLNRTVASLRDEAYEEDEISSYELDLLEVDIRKALEELEDVRDRHDDDEATDLELHKARYALQSLYIKQEELERKLAEQAKNSKKSLEDKEKDRQTRLLDYEADIASLNLDLRAKNIDLTNLDLQEEPYQEALQNYDTYAVITAPTEGTILSLTLLKGEEIREKQLIASVGAGEEFVVECGVSLENNFISAGDTCELTNASRSLKGTVTRVKPTAQGKTVSVAFSSEEAADGETFDVTFEKQSSTTYTLVPNGALRQDSDGYFLNQVKRRDGILGKEFYIERLDVYIGDSDNKNTAVTRGITFFEPIVLLSDKAVSPGDIIFLENAGDFFEN